MDSRPTAAAHQPNLYLSDPTGHLDTIEIPLTQFESQVTGSFNNPLEFDRPKLAAMPDGGVAVLRGTVIEASTPIFRPHVEIFNADGSVRVAEFDPAPPSPQFGGAQAQDIVAIEGVGSAVVLDAVPASSSGATGAQQSATLARIYNEDGVFLENKSSRTA